MRILNPPVMKINSRHVHPNHQKSLGCILYDIDWSSPATDPFLLVLGQPLLTGHHVFIFDFHEPHAAEPTDQEIGDAFAEGG
jgi:hypothetical protein